MTAEGANKFNFVSPGVKVAEVDNTRLPGVRQGDGPVVIGRTERGPALRPVTVGSFSEFVNIFGNPHAGGQGGDVWRDGNRLAPTYGAYLAQAWLKNQSQLTFVRLLGTAHDDASAAGVAGWTIGAAHDATLTPGGAFGLFLIDSGSAQTGTLAAIFYCNEGSVELSGTRRGGATAITGTAVMVASQGTDKEFKFLVKDSTGANVETISANFNRSSKKFVRSVFNTNPTLINTNCTNTSQQKTYFLGETFERSIDDVLDNNAAGTVYGVILSLQSGTVDQNVQTNSMKAARTGWFISQDLGDYSVYQADQQTKLFRLLAHDSGEWEQKNLKVSIEDIRAPLQANDYGTFTVVIRRTQDNDNATQVVERFTGCTLNPNSPTYIAAKIGDKHYEWDDNERRFRDFGNFESRSKYVRVEMNADVDAGAVNPESLPFGVLGPAQWKGFAALSGGTSPQTYGSSATGNDFADAYVAGGTSIVNATRPAVFMDVGDTAFTGSFKFPVLPLRTTSRTGVLANPKDAYFGVDSCRSDSTRFEPSYADVVRAMANQNEDATLASTQYSFVFSLDDLELQGTVDAQWVSGSRAAGDSFTALTGTYAAVLDAGFDRFTSPMFGGFDGIDITEKEPFNNRVLSGKTQITSYEFNSIKRAIDCVSDPEVVDANILCVPGITNTGITDHVLNVASSRKDCLAVIDLEGGFIPSSENTSGDSSAANRGDVATTISNLKSRAIDNTYGTAYYPWVQIRDEETGAQLWAPPSIVGVGVMGHTDRVGEPWLAPAGFTRGGLSKGDAGISVTGVRERLDEGQRNKLYEVGINPIGKFPNEGIVILGQKTLQNSQVSSVTGRINVRRMLIHVKKGIARIADRLLFEQNLQTTWDRFTGQAEPFLASVKSRFGLEDFKVILDKSTTTDDLRDRNIMYAKIFLKPAKAIEFIGIDFVISKSGASFAD